MSTVQDFVRRSAVNYLQNVVFVDDKIYSLGRPVEVSDDAINTVLSAQPNFTASEPIEDDFLPPSKKAGSTSVPPTPPPESSSQATAQKSSQRDITATERVSGYHPRELMESFAREGIVCALYEPQKGFMTSPDSELYRLCERADIVIPDWDLYGDDGDGVTALLSELIKAGESIYPHHIRLCVIYTDKPNLHTVMDALLGKLIHQGCDVEVETGCLRLKAGATRISIFGKPGSTGRPPESKSYEVKEEDLANRVIEEFAGLHKGVLPAFALHGLAAIRRNTKRVLDKFRGDMDGAFFLHRALALPDEDAFEQMPDLLADEIRAVLEDTLPSVTDIQSTSSAAIAELSIGDPKNAWTTVHGREFDAKPMLQEILLKGFAGLSEAHKVCNQAKDIGKGNSFRGIKPSHLEDFERMLQVNEKSCSEELAALFCNRTQYGDAGRSLRFGTVVRHKVNSEESWDYSICLMPICDCQRLKPNQPYRFPFWRLKEDAKCGCTGKRNGLVVVDSEETTHCLASGGKIRDMLWLADFTAGANGWVVATLADNKFTFNTSGRTVEWVAELKPLHAQRIASYMGHEISRVGLVESEWLRLFCDR